RPVAIAELTISLSRTLPVQRDLLPESDKQIGNPNALCWFLIGDPGSQMEAVCRTPIDPFAAKRKAVVDVVTEAGGKAAKGKTGVSAGWPSASIGNPPVYRPPAVDAGGAIPVDN